MSTCELEFNEDNFAAGDCPLDLTADLEGADSAPAKRARRKQTPQQAVEGDTVYARLVANNLLRKVTDIVLAKAQVPWHLREDAAQEVHVAWAALKAKPEFEVGQLARYAYMSGQHAVLKLRRTIGAVVVIPGALFRTGRDTAFMESIGAAVNPRDVDEYRDSLELCTEDDETWAPKEISREFFEARLAGLTLNKTQRSVAELAMLSGLCAEDIARQLNIRLAYVERLLTQVARMLEESDAQDN